MGINQGRWAALGALLLFLLLMGRAVPLLRWAYDVEQAGRLLTAGLRWPEPRQSDSLPQVGRPATLAQAQSYLKAAIRQRPAHPHAYRLLGQSYLAEGEWLPAVEALEQAHDRAPLHPLMGWEVGLGYEQMQRVIEQAPHRPLVPLLAQGTLEASAQPVETPFCQSGSPQRCYLGETHFRQPLASFPEGPAQTHPTLFLHAPARVSQTLTIPPDTPALRFLLGLDPAARDQGTDGAVFRVWVGPLAGALLLASEQGISAEVAQRGWVSGWADLSAWAGQEVVLVLQTDVGPAGAGQGDWYGWGDVAFTTLEAAQYASLEPQVRQIRHWQAAGLGDDWLLERGNQAERSGRMAEAFVWYQRAFAFGAPAPFGVLFQKLVQGIHGQQPESEARLQQLQTQQPDLVAHAVGAEPLALPGTALRWVAVPSQTTVVPGTPLESLAGEASVGMMPWPGSASMLLSSSDAGTYQIALSLGTGAATDPIEMSVAVDGVPLQQVRLAGGQGSFEMVSFSLSLAEGLHTLDLSLLGEATPERPIEAQVQRITVRRVGP